MERFSVALVALTFVAAGCGYGDEGKDKQPKGPVVVNPPANEPGRIAERQPATTQTLPPPPNPDQVHTRMPAQPYTAPDPDIIDGYIGTGLRTVVYTQILTEMKAVNDWLTMVYHEENGRYPKDMQELVTEYKRAGYSLRSPPPRYKHFYWPTHGVMKMVPANDGRFLDPEGKYTIKEETRLGPG